jgi:hypothetical protein
MTNQQSMKTFCQWNQLSLGDVGCMFVHDDQELGEDANIEVNDINI